MDLLIKIDLCKTLIDSKIRGGLIVEVDLMLIEVILWIATHIH